MKCGTGSNDLMLKVKWIHFRLLPFAAEKALCQLTVFPIAGMPYRGIW